MNLYPYNVGHHDLPVSSDASLTGGILAIREGHQPDYTSMIGIAAAAVAG